MKKFTIILLWIGVLAFLLIVRLVFFLKDGTNDTVELILIYTILIGSFLLLIYYFVYPVSSFKTRIKPYLKSVVLVLAIILLDTIFIVKNNLAFDRMYLFSTFFLFSIVFTVTILVNQKIRTRLHIALFIIIAVYLMIQDSYFYIFNDLFSFKELGTLREGIESSESMIHLSWYHLFTSLVLIMSFIFIKKLPTLTPPKISFKKSVVASMLFLMLVTLNAQYPVKQARLHTSDHYLYTSVFSKTSFMSTYGSANLFFRDLTKSITPNFTYSKAVEYVKTYTATNRVTRETNDYTGIFEGKNLLYIVGESFDDLSVNETLTPNLYKLKTEGWNFTNHYAPVFPRTTCDSEIIMNTSLIPSIEDGPTCYVYNSNSYSTSLANRFNNHDYLTQAFHNNYKTFYTRDLVYKGLGYDYFHGQHELNLTDTDIRYDHIFFDKAKTSMIKSDQSFFSYVLTLSGHSPYTSSNIAGNAHYEKVDNYYGNTISETLKYYIATQVEFDIMVGDMINYLDTTGLLDDTVIILTSDHYPYTLNQDDYEAYKNVDNDYHKHQVPLYIYTENITPMTYTALTSSFDLLPTIMNLFNLDGEFTYYVGNDIFDDAPSLIYFRDYSIYDGHNHMFLSDKPSSNKELLYDIAQSYYELSKNILRSNYLSDK